MTVLKLSNQMELLHVHLHLDELEEKSMREHLGMLYTKGGYTTIEGTLVCLVLCSGTYMMLQNTACYPNLKSVRNQTTDDV